MQNPRLGYVILYVPDVAAALAFYEQAFGVRRRFLHESGTYGELESGDTALAFASEALVASNGVDFAPSRPSGAAPPFEIAFVVTDIDAAYQRALDAHAVAVQPVKTKPWGQRVAYVRDLNGCIVELCTAVAT